jgi:putative tryptophan/tyrosine transport system substrate-binding protein
MRRRDFIKAIAGSPTVWPLGARAQQPEQMRRIGMLMLVSENDPQAHFPGRSRRT